MPANLTPEYIRLDEKLHQAREPEEKLTLLREMLRVIPKHKGTEKMQADLKRRISKMEEVTQQRRPRSARDLFHISREGIGQILLAGAPNGGKSSLLARLTHAAPQIASYPFTTHEPLPGMVSYEDTQIQLVDMPPLAREYTEAGFFNAYRISDRIAIVVDLAQADPVATARDGLALFADHHIEIVPHAAASGPGSTSVVEKQALILANKVDLVGPDAAAALGAELGGGFRVVGVSAHSGAGLGELPGLFFRELRVVRVYTKKPGKKFVRDAPFVLPAGATVFDVARAIHKDIAENLRFVRLWGSGLHEGLSVPREHVVADGDILEIHAL